MLNIRMAVRLLTLVSLLIVVILAPSPLSTSAQGTFSLGLTIAPPTLPADGKSYPGIIVELRNSEGLVTPAPRDIPVALSLSNPKVGSVSPSITIPKGSLDATANFQTTMRAGTTIVTATSLGFTTGSVTLETVAPVGTPSKLGLYVNPSAIPAENGYSSDLIVQLEDSRGFPANAPEDILIQLFSLDPKIGTVDSSATILKGTSHAISTFIATNLPGTTTVSATTTGYPVSSFSITTLGSVPTKLEIKALPVVVHPSDKFLWAVVQLQDAGGNPVKAFTEMAVTIVSSDTDVAKPIDSLVIRQGSSFGMARIGVEDIAEKATLAAAASGLTPSTIEIEVAPGTTTPSVLKIFAAPTTTLADGTEGPVIAVQLVDSSGKPAKATSLTGISLLVSDSNIGSVDPGLGIEGSKSFQLGNFKSTAKAGTLTVIALSPGFASVQTDITTRANVASKLALVFSPSNLFADGRESSFLTVQIQDPSGNPKPVSNNLVITMSSSNPDLGDVDSHVIIPTGKDHVDIAFKTTLRDGSTTLNAQAEGLTSASLVATTSPLLPSQIAISVVPSQILADGSLRAAVYIIPQDASGTMMFTPADIDVKLTSDNPKIGVVQDAITVPAGSPFGVASFQTSNQAGSTVITATSQGLTSASGTVQTFHLPLEAQVSAPSEVFEVGQESEVSVVVTSRGVPVEDANVAFETNLGAFSVTSLNTSLQGFATGTLSADASGTAKLIVTVSKLGFATTTSTLDVEISEAEVISPGESSSSPEEQQPGAEQRPTEQQSEETFIPEEGIVLIPERVVPESPIDQIFSFITEFPYILGGVAAAAAGVFILRRRGFKFRRGAEEEEEFVEG